MSRLEPLEPASLAADQRAVYEAIQRGPRGARHGRIGLVGPFGVWVRSPKVGLAAQAFGATLRFETSLPERVKEIAICTVGAHYRASFEFAAHASLAAAAGVPASVVEALRRREAPVLEEPAEAIAWRVTRELLDDHRIVDGTYAEALRLFGESALIELVSIVGYYCFISLTLNAFDVPLTPDMIDPFPQG